MAARILLALVMIGLCTADPAHAQTANPGKPGP